MRSSIMPVRLVLIFLLGGAVGWISSRRAAPADLPNESGTTAAEASSPKKIRHPRSPQDFSEWADERAAEMEPYVNWYSSHSTELADWPTEKIRAALNQGISDPGSVLAMGPEMKALSSLCSEFTKRDPDAAWAWLQEIPSEAMRFMLGGALANAWPADRAEEGMAMVIANREYFESKGGYGYSLVAVRALESASARGPAAADELLATMRREGMQMPFGPVKFPEGFDFAGWARCPAMAELLQQGIPGFLINTWMTREPQAAMDFIFALNREQGQPLARGLFTYMDQRTRKEPGPVIGRAQQVAARVGSLAPEEQELVFKAAAQAFVNDPAIFREFSAALPEVEMRAEANLAAARTQLSKDLPASLGLLVEGRSPEERATTLAELLGARKVQDFVFLTAADESSVRKILGEWNLPPERIDELVSTMKARPRPE